MNAQELHIDFDFNLQKINTHSTRNVESREKDWILNREVIKFLNKRTRDISDLKRKGFQEDSKRLKDVQPLIVTEELEVEHLNNKKGRFILPSFIYKNISVSSIFFKKCEESKYEEKTKKLNIYKFKIPKNFVNSSFNISIQIQGVNNVVFNTNNLPNNYINNEYIYLLKALHIILRNRLKESKFKGVKIYYEWFHEQYEQQTFYIVGGSELSNVLIGGNVSQDIKIIQKQELNLTIHNSKIEIERPSRILSQEFINDYLKSHISTSIQESPIITMDKNFGYVHYPKNVIIKKVKLSYISKPLLIDLLLNQSLNLDSDICSEIVLDAVKYVKALFDNDNYEKYINEIQLIE